MFFFSSFGRSESAETPRDAFDSAYQKGIRTFILGSRLSEPEFR